MIPIIAGIVGGLFLASRGKPTARVKKREVIGTKSGHEYQVDDLTDQGLLIVHSPSAIVTLYRLPEGGFQYVGGSGDPHMVAAIIRDFEAKARTLAPVKPPG